MINAYFWKDGEVVPFGEFPYVDNVRKARLEGLYCVDVMETVASQRYGMFHPVECWVSVPLEQFPKEFLASLLLLGASP